MGGPFGSKQNSFDVVLFSECSLYISIATFDLDNSY